MEQRIKHLRERMEQLKLEALIVDRAENIYYLSGFTGGEDAYLLVSAQDTLIFTDSRYTEQVKKESPAWTLAEQKPPLLPGLTDRARHYHRLGVEDTVTYRFFQQLKQKLGESLLPVPGLVEELRMIKDEQELACLRNAAGIGSEVFAQLLAFIKPGRNESELANRIIWKLRAGGCSKESFDPIAVAGPNAALPHGQPGERILQEGDMLTLDFGGYYQGYAGDMTRTVAVGKADSRLRDLYGRVLEAQQHGVDLVRAGMPCADLDHEVRRCLKKYDLDSYFGHGTGHGLGLNVHEPPTVSPRSDQVLKANMVITIEPGVYMPGWGGIRIEDSVIVKDNGCEVITHAPKQLIII